MAVVRYSLSAQTDLLEAWLFVAEEDTDAADRMLDVIEREGEGLRDQPLMGRTRSELGERVRSWSTSTPCILFYVVDDEGITVVRVLHHARDFRRIDL